MDDLLTTADAAKVLNRSVDSVRAYERHGKLAAQKTRSGQRLFKISDVERLAVQLSAIGRLGAKARWKKKENA